MTDKKYACSLFGLEDHELFDSCLIDTDGYCTFVLWDNKEDCTNWVNVETKKYEPKPGYPFEKVREFIEALSNKNPEWYSSLDWRYFIDEATGIKQEINAAELPD